MNDCAKRVAELEAALLVARRRIDDLERAELQKALGDAARHIEAERNQARAVAERDRSDHVADSMVVEWHGLVLRWNEPAKCFDNFEQNQAPSTAWAWATVCPHGRLWTASIHFRQIDSGFCPGDTPELALTAAAYELDHALSELRKHVRNEPEEK